MSGSNKRPRLKLEDLPEIFQRPLRRLMDDPELLEQFRVATEQYRNSLTPEDRAEHEAITSRMADMIAHGEEPSTDLDLQARRNAFKARHQKKLPDTIKLIKKVH